MEPESTAMSSVRSLQQIVLDCKERIYLALDGDHENASITVVVALLHYIACIRSHHIYSRPSHIQEAIECIFVAIAYIISPYRAQATIVAFHS